MFNKEKRDDNLIFILVGIVLCLASMFPFFVLGENSIITYNDQLDGELITYILNAKHLFEGLDTYPELMNGIPAAGMISPAPLFVLLFKVFKPFTAFLIMMLLTKLSAFHSMYLFLGKITKKSWIGFVIGVAFMMMPYYPVYGLCIPGQAFLWYAVLLLIEEKSEDESVLKKNLWAYFLIIIYGLTSSIALVGFGIVIVLTILTVVLFFKSVKNALKVLLADVILVITYALVNVPLINQLIGLGKHFVSHKSEVVIPSRDFVFLFKEYILGEYPYAACCQKVVIIFAILAILVSVLFVVIKKENEDELKERLKLLLIPVLFIACSFVLIVLYNIPAVINFRNNTQGMLHDFNFERISWMLPIAWMAVLGISMDILHECVDGDKKALKAITSIAGILACLVIFAIAGFNSDTKTSFMRMIKGREYKQISFGQFYSEDLFKKVEDIIGRDKSEYKVISMGLLPASAAYNGFNCLDAYSNNYDVSYKHEFREIMEDELAKSEYYTAYFDDWGNRCYIYLANYKTGINANFYNITFYDTEINYSKAKEMGADYVISASMIDGYENRGLTLLNETPVSSDDCWYELYIYRIN